MREIPLTQGKIALVDDADYERLSQMTWCAWSNHGRGWYAVTNVKQEGGGYKQVMMHRMILDLTDPKIKADHANGNGLDNQRHNLRVATDGQNQANRGKQRNNTSGYKGVSWDAENDQWRAAIYAQGKRKTLGRYYKKEDAARAYDKAARELHGEFAVLNFPEDGSRGGSVPVP